MIHTTVEASHESDSEALHECDPETGDVILSRRPETWDGFFAARAAADVPRDFLSGEERRQPDQERDPFQGWRE